MLKCNYIPLNSSSKVKLTGIINNISKGGVQLDISAENRFMYSHKPDDEFFVSTVLPNGKRLDVMAKIISVKNAPEPEKLSIGMYFTEMSEEAKKRLGFFLMP
jgi:hypothetical protein